MRLYEESQLTISDDSVNEPKFIRLNEVFEDIDTTNLTEMIMRDEMFAAGDTIVSLGGVATGKLLIIKPLADLAVTLNAGSAITIKGGKFTKMWATVTSLKVTVAGVDPINCLIVVAG